MDLITCLLRNSELEIHFTCNFKAQIKHLQLHQMMHHMVSQLTRFNLHIRVKGRRNVQGSEQIKKFLISSTSGPPRNLRVLTAVFQSQRVLTVVEALLKVGFCRIDKLNRTFYRTVLY